MSNTDEYYLHLMRMNMSMELRQANLTQDEYALLDRSICEAFFVFHNDFIEVICIECLDQVDADTYFYQASERWNHIIDRFEAKYDRIDKNFLIAQRTKVAQIFFLKTGRELESPHSVKHD